MQEQSILASISHYQYQFKQANKRFDQKEVQADNFSFFPKLNAQNFNFIRQCFENNTIVLLSHVSPLGETKESIQSALKDVKVLKGSSLASYCLAVEEAKVETIFADLFKEEELKYKPYLIKLLEIRQRNQLKGIKKQLIVYYHHSQEENIKRIITQFNNSCKETNVGLQNFMELQLQVPLPYQNIISQNLLQILQKFLTDQSKQPQKKDVLLFHPPSEQLKKKLFYLTKTRGFHVTTTLLYQDSQSLCQNTSTTNIFIISNSQKFRNVCEEYSIDVSRIYLILDYEEDLYRFFDYQRFCYVQVRDKISYREKCQRIFIGVGNIGEYASLAKNDGKDVIEQHEEKAYWDYGAYVLKMVQLGLSSWLEKQEKQNQQLRHCCQALRSQQIIKDNKLAIEQTLIDNCSQGINPIICSSIVSKLKSESPKVAHMLALTHCILTGPQLRNELSEQTHPSAIWHKTGYLQSCLDILIKAMYIQSSNKSQLISLEDVLSDFQVSIDKFHIIKKEYVKVCKMFQIPQIQLGAGLQEDDFVELLEELIVILKPAVGTFSGSRRLGYLFKGFNKGFLAHKKSFMAYYNEKPSFILVTKMLIDKESEAPFILDCNYIRDDIFLTTYGCLPTLSKQSYGQCEVQFHNISSAIFTHLSKYNGLQMDIFEKENDCSVEANSQLNAITIQCSKLRQKQIQQKFSKVLSDISDMFKKETRSFMQTNVLKVVIGSGGEISDLILIDKDKKNEILEIAVLKNLAPEVGIEELKQLFDQFIQLKDIKMNTKQNQNSAIISFYSVEDFKKFYQTFSGCIYYDYAMIINPFVEESKVIEKEECLLFQWNVWKSTGEAIVQFESAEFAKSALTNFKNLAGAKVIIQQKINMIFAQKLDPNVDEKDIAAWVSGNGRIKNIQVRRYQPNKEQNQQISIKHIIRGAFPKQNIQCYPNNIVKGKNGYRFCKVRVPNKDSMNEIFFVMNETKGVLGNGKLYVSPLFTEPIKLPQPDQSYANVYIDIINDLSVELNRIQPLKTQLHQQPLVWTISVQSNSRQEMQVIKSFLPERLKSVTLNVKTQDSSLLFTEIAQKNFEKLQKKLPVKIMPDIIDKKIKVLCRPSLIQLIQKQVNTQILQFFSFNIPLYQKAYSFLQGNLETIVTEQLKCGLRYIFQPINKTLNLEGNLFILEKAREKINKSLVALKQKAQESHGKGQQICELCYDQFKHAFKLQGCGHIFCFDCIQSSVRYSLKDITLYPLKCPSCADKIWVSDLSCLLQQKQWSQVLKVSVNHFVFRHPGQFMFCITAGCSFICDIKFKSSYYCPECKKAYCLQCSNLNHPGMSCHEARYGSDRLFNEYMLTNGGRVCANKACKAPIQRISGCFKVQCSRCKKCMCFKCPAGSMVAYDTPEQTYNHLNRAHGGCF